MIGAVRGRMRRRILLSYRVEREVAREMLPAPFRPQLVRGAAVGGVCLIRLEALRPGWVTAPVGAASENAAHRFAVEWDEAGSTRQGVFVTERHTSSRLATLGGGRLFPGIQQRATITVRDSATRIRVRVDAGSARVDADVERSDSWQSELFDTPQAASDFYRAGEVGWSPRRGGGFDAVTLTAERWAVSPVVPRNVASTFFDGLPAGAARFDSALLMRDIPVTWSRGRSVREGAMVSGRSHESHRFTAVAPAP